jgi:hypothetical protein
MAYMHFSIFAQGASSQREKARTPEPPTSSHIAGSQQSFVASKHTCLHVFDKLEPLFKACVSRSRRS